MLALDIGEVNLQLLVQVDLDLYDLEWMTARHSPSAVRSYRDLLGALRRERAERELTDPDGLCQSLQYRGGAIGAAKA